MDSFYVAKTKLLKLMFTIIFYYDHSTKLLDQLLLENYIIPTQTLENPD